MKGLRDIFNFKLTLYIILPLLMEFMLISKSSYRPALLIGIVQLGLFLSGLNYLKESMGVYFRKKSILFMSIAVMLFILIIFSSNFTHLTFASIKSAFLFIVPSAMLVLLVLGDRNKEKTFQLVSTSLLWFGFLISLYGLIIFYFGKYDHNIQYLEIGNFNISQIVMGKERTRISSVTSNPNVLGSLLMITIPSSAYLVKYTKKKFFYTIALIAQLITIIMTQSRASVLSIFITAVILLFISAKKKVKLIFIALGILLLFVTVAFMTDGVLLGRLADGLNGREEQWLPLIASIKQKPITGVGFGLADIVIITRETHNVYLHVLAEVGVVGLITFLSIWVYGIYNGYKKIHSPNININEKNQLLFIFSVLVGMLAHQFFETDLLQYDFITLYWVYLLSYCSQPSTSEDYILSPGSYIMGHPRSNKD